MGYIRVAGDWDGFIPKSDIPILVGPEDLMDFLGNPESEGFYVDDIEVADAGDRWDVLVHLKADIDAWITNYSPGDYWNPPEYDVEYDDMDSVGVAMEEYFMSDWERTSWNFWETDDYDFDDDDEDW